MVSLKTKMPAMSLFASTYTWKNSRTVGLKKSNEKNVKQLTIIPRTLRLFAVPYFPVGFFETRMLRLKSRHLGL